MTPPHSPSFVENSPSAAGLQPSAGPATSLQRCGSGPHQPASAEKTPRLPSPPQPCRAMATSVIRHTADSVRCQHRTLAAPEAETSRETQRQQVPAPPAATPRVDAVSAPVAAQLQNRTAVSSPHIICHMFPVSSQPGIISAFIPGAANAAVLPQPASASAAPLQQSLIVGSAVPQGTVMLVVPQPSVSQAPHCPQTVMTLGNTKLLPLAPAPVYMPAGPCGGGGAVTKMDFSRRRNYVCNFAGCRKTYFKSSHLKAHLRTHTGEHWEEGLVRLELQGRRNKV